MSGLVDGQQGRAGLGWGALLPEPAGAVAGYQRQVRQGLHVLHECRRAIHAALADPRQRERGQRQAARYPAGQGGLLARQEPRRCLDQRDRDAVGALGEASLDLAGVPGVGVQERLGRPGRFGCQLKAIQDKVRRMMEKGRVLGAGRLAFGAVGDGDLAPPGRGHRRQLHVRGKRRAAAPGQAGLPDRPDERLPPVPGMAVAGVMGAQVLRAAQNGRQYPQRTGGLPGKCRRLLRQRAGAAHLLAPRGIGSGSAVRGLRSAAASSAATRPALGGWRAALTSRQVAAPATISAQPAATSSSSPCRRSPLAYKPCTNATGQQR